MNDERFERDLRAVLADAAPDTVPITLRASLQRAVTSDPRAGRPGILSRLIPVLAALASFALLGLVIATAVVSWTGREPGFGSAPSDLVDCRPSDEPRASYDGELPQARPGEVEDIDLTGLTPNEAEAWVAERDLCISWRFYYRIDDQNTGYSEIWCTPPEGEIIGAAVNDSGIVTVLVRPEGNPILPQRPQPAVGWGCD